DLIDILAKPERITQIIDTELTEIKTQFGDKRRSEIVPFGEDISLEDLITAQDMVVTLSHTGYMKAQPLDEYRAQKRGGRGKQATATKEDDFIDNLFVANTHDYILCFSSLGRVYWLKVYEVPQGGRASRGRPIVNLLPLQEGEKINAILPVKTFDEDHYVFMATQAGVVKKTALSAFSNPRKLGIIAISLDEGDQLVGVAITSGQHQVMLFSDAGKAVRFNEDDVRALGRDTRGVRGMTLGDGQQVISLLVADSEEWQVLTASDGGYGKRTSIAEFRHTSRGTQGVIAMDLTEKTGFKLVAASLVCPTDGLMLITTGGVLIRTTVAEVRETGRSAQGVRLINLDDGEKLSGIEKVVDSDDDASDELGEGGEAGEAGDAGVDA
ncbi:MAG: DNA gyrase subunit A, partial [Burkholderiaceae bacterium]|nr:DNA gyrase subunit A [Burkholderiaceae bacterium]